MYTVVMALSWWIKAQCNKPDPNAWATVADVSWVIRQLSDAQDLSTLQKRGCDGEEDNEQSENKRRYVWLFLLTFLVINLFTSCF